VKALTSITMIVLTAAGATACGTQPAASPGGAAPAPNGSASAARTASIPPAPRETAPSPTPRSPSPTLAGQAVVTEADNGATVRLSRGQLAVVALSAGGMLSWRVPVAAGTAVRRTSAVGGYPGRLPARATFLATGRGSATLTSVNDTACLHARPACMVPQQTWQVTVIVS
jgi:hypothetical protein